MTQTVNVGFFDKKEFEQLSMWEDQGVEVIRATEKNDSQKSYVKRQHLRDEPLIGFYKDVASQIIPVTSTQTLEGDEAVRLIWSAQEDNECVAVGGLDSLVVYMPPSAVKEKFGESYSDIKRKLLEYNATENPVAAFKKGMNIFLPVLRVKPAKRYSV